MTNPTPPAPAPPADGRSLGRIVKDQLSLLGFNPVGLAFGAGSGTALSIRIVDYDKFCESIAQLVAAATTERMAGELKQEKVICDGLQRTVSSQDATIATIATLRRERDHGLKVMAEQDTVFFEWNEKVRKQVAEKDTEIAYRDNCFKSLAKMAGCSEKELAGWITKARTDLAQSSCTTAKPEAK